LKGAVTITEKHVHDAGRAIAVAVTHRDDVELSISVDIGKGEGLRLLAGCVADWRLISAVAITEQNRDNAVGAIICGALAGQDNVQFAITVDICGSASRGLLSAGRGRDRSLENLSAGGLVHGTHIKRLLVFQSGCERFLRWSDGA
jgi:hypothetical protein